MSDYYKVESLMVMGNSWNVSGMGTVYVSGLTSYTQTVSLKSTTTAKFWFPGNGVDSYLVASASITQGSLSTPVKVNGKASFYVPKEGRWSDWVSIANFALPGDVVFAFSIASLSAKIPTASSAPTTPVGVSACEYEVNAEDMGIQRWMFKVDKSSGVYNAVVSAYLNDAFQGTVDCDYTSSFSYPNGNINIQARYVNAKAHISKIQIINDETNEVLLSDNCDSLGSLTSAMFGTGNASISPAGLIKLDSGSLGLVLVGTNISLPDKFTIIFDVYCDSLPSFDGDNGLWLIAGTSTWCFAANFSATRLSIIKGNRGSGWSIFSGISGNQGDMPLSGGLEEVIYSSTLTVTTNPTAGDTLTISGGTGGDVVFTFADHYPNNSSEIQIGADVNATAANISTAINDITGAEFVATVASNVVTVTAHTSLSFSMSTTSSEISVGAVTEAIPGFNDETVSASVVFTATEGGKSVQESASASDVTDGLIDGLTEAASATAVIDCLTESMEEGVTCNASVNIDGLIDYMGEEI